jgi:regulator of cell morphogenesis and NO signaling
MTVIKEKTVADYVTENIKTAHIFKKYGIDFCCGGGVSLEKACQKKEVELERITQELMLVGSVDYMHDYDQWSLDFLIDYIVNIHHRYVHESIPIISQYATKVAKVHGHHYSEVVQINELFHQVANELLSHMQKEERVLFPYVKQLISFQKVGEIKSIPPFGSVNNPIRMMEHEHEGAGDVFKEIARLTNNYTPPKEACNTFKALYAKLEEFEQDLHKHIHLENNILHPKAIVLENELT